MILRSILPYLQDAGFIGLSVSRTDAPIGQLISPK